jgi:hypothetical protein
MTDTPHVRPFSDFLREQSGGDTHAELSEALRDLVARVRNTGKAGTLTLVIKVEPLKTSDALAVTDEIRLKLPDYNRDGSLMFTDRDGNLIGNDPNQLASFDVDRATGEVTGYDPVTGEVTGPGTP